MKMYPFHNWDLTYKDARALQSRLREKVRQKPLALSAIRYVAGADMAISTRLGQAFGAVVVFQFPELVQVEVQVARLDLSFPYIPGLLSFREIPVLAKCLSRVKTSFQVLVCDGQGIAHPRGFGLASHLGVLLRRPTIGCAKSRLVGEHDPVAQGRGGFSRLIFKGKQVGSVLRTRDAVRPVYVSPGHLMNQVSARRIVLACATRYRLPEPTRAADALAAEEKRRCGT